MYKITSSFCLSFVLLITNLVNAQQPKKPSSVEIFNSIKKLNFLGTVLYVAAHPDDENTRLISYMSNKLHARTGYLSLTRGDGGQNLIGAEIRELLGVIRTQELLAARRIDGGEQFFSRANDFGYSKNPDETLSIWNKNEVLSDVVWAIRKFKPDVIINRFDHRTPGTTHGHHTSSAMLSVEAFDIAGSKKSYKDHLEYVDTWQPQRLFFNTSWWFYGGREKFEKADKSNLVSFDIGTYYQDLGLSNTEIASLSRSQHKSQGFGNTGTRGSQQEYIELIKGKMPSDKASIFEGIDTSWNRVEGGKEIGEILLNVENNFDYKNPSASVPKLVEAYKLIQLLKDEHWKTVKTNQIKSIIAAASGLYLEAVTTESALTRNSAVKLKIEAINRSSTPIKFNSIEIPTIGIKKEMNENLGENSSKKIDLEAKIKIDQNYTSPYWLNEKGTLGMYKVNDQKIIGNPETKKETIAYFDLEVNEVKIPFEKELVFKKNDPVKGEVYKPFEIVPEVSVGLLDKVIIFKDGNSKKIEVKLTSYKDNIKGKVSLKVPNSWKVTPLENSYDLELKGGEQVVSFTVTPPATQNEGYIHPEATIGDNKLVFMDEVVTMDYAHIPFQTTIIPSQAKVVRLDIKKLGQEIGYIEGAGDVVPESLKQIGYNVTTIPVASINETSLQSFDAIVVGIRAYNTVESLKFKQTHLLEYVKKGGNLIVQYNTSHRLKVTENLGPYPLKLSRDRVTDEKATVTLLEKEHPVLNTPNKITAADFEGWVQERGLYFPNEWSKEYTPIMAINDVGETPKKGALLVAKYGEGHYVYTGISFFREFPAGVSGAYRLFANILSLGKK